MQYFQFKYALSAKSTQIALIPICVQVEAVNMHAEAMIAAIWLNA